MDARVDHILNHVLKFHYPRIESELADIHFLFCILYLSLPAILWQCHSSNLVLDQIIFLRKILGESESDNLNISTGSFGLQG